MKKNILAILSFILLCGCATNGTILNEQSDIFKKSYYTRTNLWYSSQGIISTWSSHNGGIIPLGTKVKIIKMGSKELEFKANSRTIFTIRRSRHTNAPLPDLFDIYFSEKNVMGQGSKFYDLTKVEQINVQTATIALGMSKEAVLLAYGYPPARDGTIDIDENLWTYWGPTKQEARISIYFLNNIAYKIERLEVGSFRGPLGRRTKIHKEELTGTDKYNAINRVKLEQNEYSLSEELRNLSELHSSGALTDEEFKKAKEKLLGKVGESGVTSRH